MARSRPPVNKKTRVGPHRCRQRESHLHVLNALSSPAAVAVPAESLRQLHDSWAFLTQGGVRLWTQDSSSGHSSRRSKSSLELKCFVCHKIVLVKPWSSSCIILSDGYCQT